jgi:bacterioferritin-associated ferredoxin
MACAMSVCLCNAITGRQASLAARSGATQPKKVFASFGRDARCAACRREMVNLLRQCTRRPCA